ncbi:hypothetical protein C8J57DRAFT_1674468 [Mycena rebaudengoi]|nr:hypothetical protein C8J57DRAFT_1674468 [Mycena rebaudengoi]
MQKRRPTRPPETGVRRPRSPDPSLSSGDEESPLRSITKSPHTARVIKRGKTSGPDATLVLDANQTTAAHPAPIPVFTTHDNDDVEVLDPIVTMTLAGLLAEKLQKELTAALATARSFRECADGGKSLPPHTMERVTALLSLVGEIRDTILPTEDTAPSQSPAEKDQPSPHTFAEAAKAQPDRPLPRAQQASKPKRPAPAPKRATQRTTPSTRLIVEFAGSRPTKRPHPDTLCRAINDVLDGRLAVSAVSTSRNGNLVLHASAPACSAQALAAHRSLIWKTIAPLLGIVDPTEPPIYPADPWHKVVFHRVPMMQPGVLPSSRDFVREVAKRNQLPGTQYRIGNVRFLHGRDAVPPAEVTVRVDFIEEEDARCFLREGIFLFGSHCRATRYKPRATNGGRTSGGN